MPNSEQQKDFAELIRDEYANVEISESVLSAAIDYISDNLDPDDVFGDRKLFDWAANYEPDKLFSQNDLGKWAESNGYVKGE